MAKNMNFHDYVGALVKQDKVDVIYLPELKFANHRKIMNAVIQQDSEKTAING